MRSEGRRSGGFLLLTVAVALGLLAALAYAMGREGASGADRVAASAEGDRARYVAEAGLAHARWQADQAGCSGYALPTTPFQGHAYEALFSPTSGSPVKIKATGTLANGVNRTRSGEFAVYDPSTFTTLTLQPGPGDGKDAWVTSGQVNWNYGAHNLLAVDEPSQRSLLEFDLSDLPGPAHIRSATLELYVQQLQSPGDVTIHRVQNAWTDGTCQGAGCTADGVTWATRDAVQPWGTPGVDHDPVPAATLSLTSVGMKAWDVTPLVRGWTDGTLPNHGLLVKAAVANVDFSSSDSATVATRPRLTLAYDCECGIPCNTALDVLVVVPDAAALSDQDLTKQTLIESWGYNVTLLSQSETQEAYDAAVDDSDVVYVSEEVSSSEVNTKLREQAIGIVSEEAYLNDEFGFSSGRAAYTDSQIDIVDDTHYITAPFGLGLLTIATSSQLLHTVSGTLAPDLKTLAEQPGASGGTLVWLDEGDALWGGGTAAGRRVLLPWGPNDFDIHSLNDDGHTLMRRAIEWGALGDAAWGGTTETLTAIADNRLEEGSSANHGSSSELATGELTTGLRERPVLRFDLATIPVGATVHAATLRLNAKRRSTGYATYLLSLGPEAYWRLGEPSGTSAADASGNGHDGQYKNGILLGQAPGSIDSDTAVGLDGADDFVNAGKFDVNGSGVTLMAWVRFASFGNDTRMISKATSTAEQDHWWMLSEAAERLRLRVKAGGTTKTLLASSGGLSTGVWYFAVGTYDGATMRLYLDGEEVGSTSHSGSVSIDSGVRVAVGANPLGGAGAERYHHGRIDEAAVFDYALSAAQIQTLYSLWTNAGFDVGAHRMTEGWTEAGSNWATSNGSSPWAGGPGGSYDPVAVDTSSAQGAGTYTWTVTALVQEWVDGISPNHGFELVAPPVADGSRLALDSREGTMPPELEVTYSGP